MDLFEAWAPTYDETVGGHDEEYKEVFDGYEAILKRVADTLVGPVLEFGVGTGNLTQHMLERGHQVYGVEPSPSMRRRAAARFPQISVVDGDFLDFPVPPVLIQSVTSTYAFHHLTDEEKDEALQTYGALLPRGGRIVFADTAYDSDKGRQDIIRWAEEQGYVNLVADLHREYYTTLPVLQALFESAGFDVLFTRCNRFVWVMDARKK